MGSRGFSFPGEREEGERGSVSGLRSLHLAGPLAAGVASPVLRYSLFRQCSEPPPHSPEPILCLPCFPHCPHPPPAHLRALCTTLQVRLFLLPRARAGPEHPGLQREPQQQLSLGVPHCPRFSTPPSVQSFFPVWARGLWRKSAICPLPQCSYYSLLVSSSVQLPLPQGSQWVMEKLA